MKRVVVLLACLVSSCVASAQNPFVEMPPYARTFTSALARGFQCEAPCDLRIVGIRVPNERNLSLQSAAVFRMIVRPPQFSQTTIKTPSWVQANGVAGAIWSISPGIDVDHREWIGVLGGCSARNSTLLASSYGASGPYSSGMIGGQVTTIYRLLANSSITTISTNPPGPVSLSSEDAGPPARVETYVVACCGSTPRPTVGSQVAITCEAGLDAGRTYALALSRTQGPTPIGRRQIDLGADGLFFLTVNNLVPNLLQNAQGVLDANGMATALLNVPNLSILVGTKIYAAFVTLDINKPDGISSISRNFEMTLT